MQRDLRTFFQIFMRAAPRMAIQLGGGPIQVAVQRMSISSKTCPLGTSHQAPSNQIHQALGTGATGHQASGNKCQSPGAWQPGK